MIFYRNILLNIIIYLLFTCSANAQWKARSYMSTVFGMNYGSLIDADFLSAQEGIYCFSYYFSPSSGSAYRGFFTTDSGSTWVPNNYVISDHYLSIPKQRTILMYGSSPFTSGIGKAEGSVTALYNLATWYGSVASIHTTDSSYIYILNQRELLKYKNGQLFRNIHNFNYYTRRLYFIDEMNGFVVCDSSYQSSLLFKTNDGGVTFAQVFSGSPRINTLHFTDSMNGYLIADRGKLWVTRDGGQNWVTVNLGTTLDLYAINFYDQDHGFIGGKNGLIMRTIDGGNTWTRDTINTSERVSKFTCINEYVTYAIAGQYVFMLDRTPPPEPETPCFIPVIHPNPNQGVFTILLTESDQKLLDTEIFIFDISGNLVYKKKINSANSISPFEDKVLSSGLYFYQYDCGKAIRYGKIVVY